MTKISNEEDLERSSTENSDVERSSIEKTSEKDSDINEKSEYSTGKPEKYPFVPFVGRKKPREAFSSLETADIIPLATASLFSIWTFSWLNPLLILGYQRPLYQNDLYKLTDEQGSGYLADKLMANFERRRIAIEERNAQIENGTFKQSFIGRLRGKPKKKTVGLAGAISDTFFYTFWSAGGIKVIGDFATVLSPLVTKALINFGTDAYYANKGVPGFTMPNVGVGIGLCIALWVMQAIAAFATHQFFYRSAAGTGVMARGALIAAIYRKSMKLSGKSRTVITNGALVNHLSTDVSRIDFCLGFFHMSWTAFISIALIIVLLLLNLGPSALAGIGFLFITSPLQGLAMKKMFSLRIASMVWTDKRSKLIMELLNGMRVIKFFAWEVPYLAKLNEIRKAELKHIRTLLFIRALNSAVAMSIPVLATVIAFLVYAADGRPINPAIIFTSLSLFTLLRFPLMFLPMALSTITDAHNATQRLTRVFLADEITETFAVDLNSEFAIQVDASFQWEGPPPAAPTKKEVKAAKKSSKAKLSAEIDIETPMEIAQLSNIKLSIPRGALVAICGPVGSGKSSLLQALLGEMRRTRGEVIFGGSVSYCPQNSWIRNATLRENIIFGQDFDEERYQEVIRCASLEADLKMLPNGDMTEIGEKGINLSGGQKQRVSIARALYYDADTVLLDDPLSAVDAHVGASLFSQAICGMLHDKTRVLVTHALHFLPKVDYVVYIEKGQIIEQGTYAQLMAKEDGTFSQLVKDFGGAAREKQEEAEVVEVEEKKEAVVTVKKGLMQEEERTTGAVSLSIYKKYLKAAKGYRTVPFLVLSLVLMQVSQILGSYWLVWWSEDYFNKDRNFYMGIYAALGVLQAAFSILMGTAGVLLGFQASKALHFDAIEGIMAAPMSFFETTPLGRIMNRFSKDIDTIDNTLNDAVRMVLTTLSSVVGSILLIIIVQHYFAIAVAFIIVLYVLASLFYRASAREIKRLDNILRSSLYAFFSETLSGLSTIRAYGESEKFLKQNEKFVDIENRAYFLTVCNQRWLGLRLDFFGSILTLLVALIGVAGRFTISPAQTGLILSYVLTISSSFSWLVRQSAEVENDMSSVERLCHYAGNLAAEPPRLLPHRPPTNWPEAGTISFKKVVMAYRPELPVVLKGISFEIKAGEKIGIIGRTGAGKSSIMSAIFRFIELTSGSIEIDGEDVSKIGTHDLRSKISIIPQEAFLFSGTIRSNLDPFNLHEDQVLWSALKRAWLVDQSQELPVAGAIRSGSASPERASRFTLDLVIEDEGMNLSVGERSLVSLARALVSDCQVLLLDECTSSVDAGLDSKIQQTIRTEFAHKTLLCIAHRISTIVGYDRIIVMSDGQVEEFDTPINLWKSRGHFHSLCVASGLGESDMKNDFKD